jgi:hypothetical protein
VFSITELLQNTPEAGTLLVDFNSFIDEHLGVYEILHFLTADRRDLFEEWITKPRDYQASSRLIVGSHGWKKGT